MEKTLNPRLVSQDESDKYARVREEMWDASHIVKRVALENGATLESSEAMASEFYVEACQRALTAIYLARIME